MANEVEIVVTGKDRTGSVFAGIRQKLKDTLRRTQSDTDASGQSIGRRLISSIGDSLQRGAGYVTDSMQSVFSGSLKGALSTPIAGPIIIAAVGALAAGIAPVLATAIGGALILGMGAALVGFGAMILLQNEKIKGEFTKTFGEIKNILTDAFMPLKPVLDTVRTVLKGLASEFAPVIKSAMAMAKGPLIGFVKNLGKAFEQFKPAIKPIMEAFNQLLEGIGPMLPGLFKSIAGSLIELSKTVVENKDLFLALFVGLMSAIPPVIDAIGGLIRFFRTLMNVTIDVFSSMASTVLGWADTVLGAAKAVVDAIAKIPGPWQSAMRAASASIQGARDQVRNWKTDVERMPKVVRLNAEIGQLQSKLATAKRELKDPNLTKERRAKLNAEISQLQDRIRAAKAALASVQGKTVNVHVRYTESGRSVINGIPSRGAFDRAHGGIIGAAGGGPRSAMTLVGEQGPELVSLPFGSSVTPAGQTRTKLGQMAGGGGGLTVNVYVQGSIRSDRDLVKLIKDEFINGGFRGAITP